VKLSDFLAQFLVKKGIKTVFGYQGGSITHIIESLNQTDGIKYIQNYNEQGSAFAADAYSRTSEESIGCALGTNGPGATNMVTGIANAWCDSIPVLFLTGQVNTFTMKKSYAIRQESFQEINILDVVKSITKYAVTVMEKNDIQYELEKALYLAKKGRPGPVLVDLPVDVQGDEIEIEKLCHFEIPSEEKEIESDKIDEALSILKIATKPLIIAGGGIRNGNCVERFRQLVETNNIPVIVSLMGLDVIDTESDQFIGFFGSYGNRAANIAVNHADVILVLGSRLDMRQTGKQKKLFAPNAKILHVDIDNNELRHFLPETISINLNVSNFLEYMEKFTFDNKEAVVAWLALLKSWNNKYTDFNIRKDKNGSWNPNILYGKLAKIFVDNTIVTADVGQNQMWLAQSLRIGGKNIRILNSGGLGAMGYSLPASIGAYFAQPKKQIVAFMGDGGFQMNIQELMVIGDKQLPIKIFIINNHALGLIRDIHKKYYHEHYIGSVEGFTIPDLKDIAKAYGLKYKKISSLKDLKKVDCLIFNDTPVLFECDFPAFTYLIPELMGSDAIDHQVPYLSVNDYQDIESDIRRLDKTYTEGGK
jgi:acetolactate synthase I/II/III large subunit